MKLLVLILLVLISTGAVASTKVDAPTSLIQVSASNLQSESLLKERWMAVPATARQKIEDHLMRKLGLSSTGSVRLIGVYTSQGDRAAVFHLQQLDLFDQRLFWSVLVDPKAMEARVLFDIGERSVTGSWVRLD
jgi:hypothetical protein